MEKNKIIIYQHKSGAIEFKGDFTKETIWATQAQMALAFNVNVRTINEHIKNIYKTKELTEKSTIRNFRIVQDEGGRNITRIIKHYNLDMILSVGYRVNSKTATRFRQWSTKILRQHIIQGYTINKKRIAKNYNEFLQMVESVKKLLPKGGQVKAEDVLELIKMFSNTWFSLDAYDKENLPKTGKSKKRTQIKSDELEQAIQDLKRTLVKQKLASHLFAVETRAGSLVGIVGNVLQSFGGKDVYPTLEEKAAHLLYFIVKNHPFTDGNKRVGAFAFVWFLRKTNLLQKVDISTTGLTALTLLVAESNPKDKQKMISLILLLLNR